MSAVQIITDINKLGNAQLGLEKSLQVIQEYVSKFDGNVAEMYLEMEKQRDIQRNALKVSIANISEPLAVKLNMIQDNKLEEVTDFRTFKKEMIKLQDNIQSLKTATKLRFQELSSEEEILDLDMNFYNDCIEEWSKPIKVDRSCKVIIHKRSTINMKHTHKEVKEFMDFVHENGGHENGWNKEDHLLFLQIRKKYKTIDNIAKHVHLQLPDISELEVKRHDEWYTKYLSLNNKKKEAIRNWKEQKAKPEKIPHKIINPKLKFPAKIDKTELEEKLRQWKIERKERLQNAKETLLEKEHRLREIEEARKRRNEDLKKMVEEWKQIKVGYDQQEKLERELVEQNEKRRRAVEANHMIKQYQAQDDLYISRMVQKRKHEGKSPIRTKSCQIAERNPERLFKPTEQWINRTTDEPINDSFGSVNFVKCIPKLGNRSRDIAFQKLRT